MSEVKSEIKNPDPSALGLFGLAIVTFVASSQKLGITTGLSYVVPWAVFLGAIAQLIAGIYDYKKCNVFGATAFIAFGLFWLANATTWIISLGVFGQTLQADSDVQQLGFALLGYFIFSFYMTIGSMETNKVLFLIFVFIDFLFIGLSLSSFGIFKETAHMIAAVSELAIALLSFYLSAANILNIQFERVFLPIGKPFGIFKKS